MKKLLIFTLILILVRCQESQKSEVSTDDIYFDEGYNSVDKNLIPIITFEEEDFNFGIILEGEKVNHTYRFTNTGKRDLILANVSADCGCTTPKKFSRDPIKYGESGEIFIEFDSANKIGKIKKKITVVTNSIPNTKVITISGEVMNTENLIKIDQEQ